MESQQLSNREIDILKLVAQAKSNKEIANELFISVNTVKVHLSNIFQKIGVSSRTEATLFAIEHKLFDFPALETIENRILEPKIESKIPETKNISKFLTRYWWTIAFAALVLVIGLSTLISQINLFTNPSPTSNPMMDTLNQQRWREMPPLPTARQQIAIVSWDNEIYAIGGVSDGGVSEVVERYSLNTNSWTTLQSKPTAIRAAGAAILGGKIYVPGGQKADNSLSTTLEVYDPRADQWETKAPMPVPLANNGIVSHEGNLYLFGGKDDKEELNLVLRYNPNNDEWSTMTPLPTARSSSSAIDMGDSIFIFGGNCNGRLCQSSEVYTPSLDNGDDNPWSKQLSLESDGKFIGGQEVSGMLFLFSWEEQGGIRIQNFIPLNNTWSTYTEEPIVLPSELSQLTSLGGHVFFIGGINEAGKPSSKVVRYQAVFTIVLPQVSN